MRFRKTAGVLRTAVAMTVTTALAAPAEAATSARDGHRVVADEVGDAAYTLGVLATPVGAVPVGYPPLVVDVAVACGKLPDHPLRTA